MVDHLIRPIRLKILRERLATGRPTQADSLRLEALVFERLRNRPASLYKILAVYAPRSYSGTGPALFLNLPNRGLCIVRQSFALFLCTLLSFTALLSSPAAGTITPLAVFDQNLPE